MQRDANQYQIATGKKLADASRDELEQELMRAMDALEYLERKLIPLTLLLDDYMRSSPTFDLAISRFRQPEDIET